MTKPSARLWSRLVSRLLSAAVAAGSLASPLSAQSVVDPNLKVQTWVSGFDNPTGAAVFNTRGDMMVIEKNTGKVRVVRDRRAKTAALLDLPVANDSERGLLGIALSPNFANDNFVYLYHTAANSDGAAPISNKISRYRYNGSGLVFDRKIIDLPVLNGPNHNGGRLAFGPDGKLYTVIGDLNLNNATSNYGGTAVQATGSVLRLNPNGGDSLRDNPFYQISTGLPPTGVHVSTTVTIGNPGGGSVNLGGPAVVRPRSDIYAYGIRNSFGIAFEPRTGDLWDTENGPASFDEVNRVFKGFNGGWEKIIGPVSRNGGELPELNSLGGAAVYDDPKFSWSTPVAPTDLDFFPTTRLGAQYKDDLFIGSVRGGKIFHFDLTATHKSLSLTGGLSDGVADNSTSDRFAEQESILFGSDFGLVSDLFAGPGGMYVVNLTGGNIYRITTADAQRRPAAVPEPMIGLAALGALLCRRR